MRQIRFTKTADRDLSSIHLFTYEKWGSEQARKYAALLEDALIKIAEEPERVGTRDQSSLRPRCRSIHVQRHFIFYRIAADDALEVLRILHDAMDIERHF